MLRLTIAGLLLLGTSTLIWADEAVVLTPAAAPAPHINGPRVYGCRPDRPLLYRIPATGTRPIAFAAEGLPDGLKLDAATGIITGSIAQRGEYPVTLRARNDLGADSRTWKIVCGDTLALTPPMGWNSWYIHYGHVTDQHMRTAADQMIASGMADYGYQYVNIDDCWGNAPKHGKFIRDPQRVGPSRDAEGNILPNHFFPDMKAMTDYIHGKGLKAGIYTSPGPLTCGGYTGSYEHEAQDARQFAAWGFDFLKYDWCSYGSVSGGTTLDKQQKPFRLMWGELQKLDRDIVFNLCQYGKGEVWKWGGEMGNCWRTTRDLGGTKVTNLPGFYVIGFMNAEHWENARPGGWNDPDYILIGWVDDSGQMGESRQTTLTPDEQYAFMSMWCLMAAPLIFSGDMAKLDPFTLNVLCNHEVIDVDQDVLGRQARIVRKTDREFILAKDLEDGSKAVGLFNLAADAAPIAMKWSDFDLTGKQRIRDLWRQKDLGTEDGTYKVTIPAHGVLLLRMWPDGVKKP